MKFQAPKGTKDVLPGESYKWEQVILKFKNIVSLAGYGLTVSPMFEDANLFKRGAGESSDVTRKEMYEFQDKGGRLIALRPEGTASIVRAFIEHSLPTPFRTWYLTPAFRYERHQKARYRQHHQLGVEVLGALSPSVDVEVIDLAGTFFDSLALKDRELIINSMGDENCRPQYKEKLLKYLISNKASLCDEHIEHVELNPLRVLDCKTESCRSIVSGAPKIDENLCSDCEAYYGRVLDGLSQLGIKTRKDPTLVRGFDYYTRTTFEFTSHVLSGTQNAIGGGGRYDNLVESLGGPKTPGIGFGIGIERILLVMSELGLEMDEQKRPDVFIVDLTNGSLNSELSHKLRSHGISTIISGQETSLKSQLRMANKSNARVCIIIGERELKDGKVSLKDLDAAGDQIVEINRVEESVKNILKNH